MLLSLSKGATFYFSILLFKEHHLGHFIFKSFPHSFNILTSKISLSYSFPLNSHEIVEILVYVIALYFLINELYNIFYSSRKKLR